MIEITDYGDVRRIQMWTWRTRAAGYDVSAYLVRGVLIDAGFRQVGGELERVLRERRPRGVIVTHWHEDHAGNAPAFAAQGVPLWLHPYTERKLRERQQVKLYRHIVWGRPRALSSTVTPLDPVPLTLVHTPGHAADHHVVYDADTGTVFGGDLWLGVKVRVVGYEEDPYQIISSLDRVIALRPRRLFDAHRGHVENPIDALAARRDWMRDTVTAVEERLSRGDPEDVILREVLDGEERSAWFTQGEYSRRNFIRTVRRHSGD